MSTGPSQTPGRRLTAGRRIDVLVLLAVALPVLTALAVVLVRPASTASAEHPPTRTALNRATVVCPSPIDSGTGVSVTSAAAGARGQVRVGLGDAARSASIKAGRVTSVDAGRGPVAVTGEDATAPGLLAARSAARQPATVACGAPAPDVWFTGVGAGAGHTSVLELVNPDPGTAIADVTVQGHTGVIDAPRLRGVSVPGRSSVQLDLGDIVPRRDELAINVVAARGRIGSSVLDRLDPVGPATLTQDWLPSQEQPRTDNLLMGLAKGTGRRTLVIANGGQDEVRAQVKVVTDGSTFAPKDLPEIRVAPQSVTRVEIAGVLNPAVKDGATGLQVTATEPVTATLRSYVGGDLSHAVPSQTVGTPTAVLLPPGGRRVDRTLELAGAPQTGAVTVVARSATGKKLDTTRVDVIPGRGATVDVPADAVLLSVTPARTTVQGAVISDGGGATVVPLTVPASKGLVPEVGPGLP